MADADAVRRDVPLVSLPRVRKHVLGVTAVVTIVAYALVGLTFAGMLPYPSISKATVGVLEWVITLLNAVSLVALCLGWYYVRRGRIRAHRRAMLTGIATIVVFLVLYLEKVGGGGIKEFVGPAWVKAYVYLPMLGIHEILSALAVPLVAYALVVGLTTPIRDLPNTAHPRVGRWAAVTWILSLLLGIVTFVLINLVYDWTFQSTLPF
ncbi:hypothetical protein MBEHAL_0869 [Halarchaeum acidiphilum MH1-52-1]|uniref:DUF420 domain-containing protein n=1 Tax=Halarchaeum acidiphilum MH1-52-1 TaxID=1261545 RepID=U3A380_9EURY|nr:DUF420 domain-containing protein [Halarchaeum acidiphilum]GAD52109.1 hypothetical protein MBEHAL_0869 [Halarchaeum acidiphilum MH1-52-1]